MITPINISEIFIQTHDEHISLHKKTKNSKILKHIAQNRYIEFLYFTSNSCYWIRYNKNSLGKYNDNCIKKYLNQIHHIMETAH